MDRLRFALFMLLSVILALSPPLASAQDGVNDLFALILHGVTGQMQPCEIANGLACYCPYGPVPPQVIVPPNTEITVFIAVWNICDDPDLTGIQTAFEWDPSWTFLGSAWDCREHQTAGPTPHDPGGPDSGTIATAFDCATGSNVVLIGRLFFITGSNGCLRQVSPSHPLGIHVVDCDHALNQIDFAWHMDPYRLGGVCVEGEAPPYGEGCYDPMPVSPRTWGFVKSLYDP